MVRKILKLGDETLRKNSKPMQKFDLRLWLLLRDMADTMYKAEGVGLAAPQVGVLRRLIVIDVSEKRNELMQLANPVIVSQEGSCKEAEGCLSIPGRRGIVDRPAKVTVRALNRRGKEVEIQAEGLLARALCHEIDHLDGILYTDKMIEDVTDKEELPQ